MNNGNNSENNGWNNSGFTPNNSPNYGSESHNITYVTAPPVQNGPVRKKKSPLSIVAFVFSFTVILSFVGIILGIIDLVKKDKEKSHGLSKAAIAVGGSLTALLIISRLNLISYIFPSNQTSVSQTNDNNSSEKGTVNTQKAEYSAKTLIFEIIPDKYGSGYKYRALVEIKNTGKCNLYIHGESFDIEDKNKHLIQTDEYLIGCCPNIIKPNEKGYIFTTNERELKNVTSVDDLVLVPKAGIEPTSASLNEYTVSDVSVFENKYGQPEVVGRITNNTKKNESSAYLYAFYYDSKGEILGIIRDSAPYLEAGKTVSFDMNGLLGWDINFEAIASYKIIAINYYFGF